METARQVLSFCGVLLLVILIFNLMIVVHELGHFLAARWRGLKVERFYVWFGKPLWRRTFNGVEYGLGSIPFGGYVALPQMAPMPESLEGPSPGDLTREQLPPVSALDKIIVAFAGPLFSFLLAFVFAIIVWAVGKPVSEGEATTTVGHVVPGGPAFRAGMRPGDVIESIEGRPVSRFFGLTQSVVWAITRSEGATIPIEVKRDDKLLTLNVLPYYEARPGWGRKSTRQILVEPAYTPLVGKVEPGSAAAQAGIQPGDALRTADGAKLHHPYNLIEVEETRTGQPVRLTLERNGQTLEKTLVAPPRLGIRSVVEGSPAAQAGIKPGDAIVAADERPLTHNYELGELLKAGGEQPVRLTVRRGAELLEKIVTPQRQASQGGTPIIGVAWNLNADGIAWDDGGTSHLSHPGPIEQVNAGVATIVNTIGALLSPKSDIKLQHLSGPIGIGHGYYNLLTSEQGWRLALWFSVVLNVNLALMNLLPIPVLDGGHITLALVEAVRRKPVNLRVLEAIQTGCFLFIVGVALYITFFDLGDFAGSSRPKFRRSAANATASAPAPAPQSAPAATP